MNKKKDIHTSPGEVPAPKTSSPTGHEEIEAQVVKEQQGDEDGSPPKPNRPGASENPVPKANTPPKK